MKPRLAILTVLILAVVYLVSQLLGIRTELNAYGDAVEKAWTVLDEAMQQRAEMIPALIERMKGFAGEAEEKEIREAIETSRAAFLRARTPQQRIDTTLRLDHDVNRYFILAEGFMKLVRDENFNRLEREYAAADNKIAEQRQRYNQAIQKYNMAIEKFPNNIAAAVFGFHRNDAYLRAVPVNSAEVPDQHRF